MQNIDLTSLLSLFYVIFLFTVYSKLNFNAYLVPIISTHQNNLFIMKNAQPPIDALKKITINPSDLQKKGLVNKNLQILDSPIENSETEINGEYSFFSSQQVGFWDTKFSTKSRVLLTYPAEILSTHFYLLYFKSTNCLNLRINIDIPVNEILLNGQSGSGLGSFLWASNVGLELMIPPNTQVNFQLLVIPKKQLLEQIKSTTSTACQKLTIFGNSNVPLFFFSKEAPALVDLVTLRKKSVNQKQKREEILNILIKYFSLNIELSNEKCTLWDFQNMLIIEQHISQLPADLKPNLTQLSQLFDYFPQAFSKLFRELFGKSIVEYHCAIHMEYACWLLETQQLSVCEVSDQLDFKNRKMFSQMFKSHYFVSPKIYKVKTS